MQSQFFGLEENLLSQLECPVCMEYMTPPITICANGHNICNICRRDVQLCPTCRGQFLKTRNVALEKVTADVKQPCVYQKYGCQEIYGLDSIVEHQEKCRYIPQPCPVKKLNLGTCNWTGISSSVRSHLKDAHKDCLDKNSYRLRLINRPFQISGVTPATKQCKLIFASNVIFYSCSEIKNGIFYSALLYIGRAADAAKYKYKLEFSNKERPESLSMTLLARSLDEDLSEVHETGNCVKLYPDQYNRFANDRNELAFSMEISSV